MTDHSDKDHRKDAAHHYGRRSINDAFNHFLGIRDEDRNILKKYHPDLIEGGEEFAEVFYSYLLAYPATASILERYRERGGEIRNLVHTQLEHLWNFLSGDTSESSATRLVEVGALHQRFGIEPVWVMGAYLLYWDHLHGRLATDMDLPSNERPILEGAISKFLFRDMGLLLEGHWDASMQAVESERKKVAELQSQVTSLLSNLPQVLWSVDVIRNRLLYISPTAHQICNLDVAMPIPCLGWTVLEDRATVLHAWQRALNGEQVEVESRVIAPGEPLRWFRRVFRPFQDAAGKVVRIDGLMEDATDVRLAIERLNELATTDSLTGLHNRALFHDLLEQAIAIARRSETHRQVVLMLMDLDHFKEINDTLGHPAGDAMLQLVAERLKAVLRDTDTLARLGGDEFAILLPEVRDGRKTAGMVAKSIVESLAKPFRYGEHELYLGAGVGVAVFPDHGEDVSTLMSRADVAMYGAKHKDTPYVFYDAASDTHTPQRLQFMSELRRALDQGEFELHYQPQVEVRHRCVTGVEALLRWNHPLHGLLHPEQFLATAERTGIINPLTDWVIGQALRQSRLWHMAGLPLRVGVNMTGRSFMQADLPERIARLIDEAGARPECLEIEITENVLMADIEHGSLVLKRLDEMGVTISIDDYGTGYSSLAYLKKLPLHILKIDKSFVVDMARDENDAVIVRSTIDLAHNLGHRVVAEGVEDSDAYDLLSILGCDSVQGYFVSRPVQPGVFESWLRKASWGLPGTVPH